VFQFKNAYVPWRFGFNLNRAFATWHSGLQFENVVVQPAAFDFIRKLSYCRLAILISFEISPLALWGF
jgi:hypothetical protein